MEPQAGLAVFVHIAHGDFQAALVTRSSDISQTATYRLNDCIVRPAGCDSAANPPLFSITQIPASVFIFINRPLETLNHLFFDELAKTALRPECGVATGVSADCVGPGSITSVQTISDG